MNASGTYAITGSANHTVSSDATGFADWLRDASDGTPAEDAAGEVATQWAHVLPWIQPVWMSEWGVVRTVSALLVCLGWLGVESVVRWRGA